MSYIHRYVIPFFFVLFLILCAGCQYSTDTARRFRTSEETLDTFRRNIDMEKFAWLRVAADRQLEGCQIQAHDGTSLFTPDGIGNYRALWTRDFAFMVEYAGDLLEDREVHEAVRYLLHGQRPDGCMPDRVREDGVAVYSPGGESNPINDHAKDNGPFMAKLVILDVNRRGDLSFFSEVEGAIERGMDFLKRSPTGLVWNDPNDPQSPFGFTDTIAKSGDLLFSSLLYWEACNDLADLCRRSGAGDAAKYRKQARRIRSSLDTLWDEDSGMFFAASEDCRQIDIWGSAYAVYVGAASRRQSARIAEYLDRNYSSIVSHGQVRHLPAGQFWERMLIPIKPGTYQNGAFWGTASGWVIAVLARRNPEKAAEMFNALVVDYQNHGIHECINGEYRKVPHYVSSATNPYGVVRAML